MHIAVITPTYPPNACGVGDYTHRLSRELSKSARVTVITTRRKTPRPETSVTVREAFAWNDPKTIFEVLAELEQLRPDWVLLQYDPYSYGAKHALNPYLPLMARRLKKRFPGMRLGVVVHETFADASNFKRAVMTTWQRAQLWTLGRAADLLVFVVEAWSERLRSWFPRTRVVHLPVGNNIPRLPLTREEAKKSLEIPSEKLVIGWFGRSVPTFNLAWLKDAVRGAELGGAPPLVVHVGVGSDDAKRILGATPLRIGGSLPAEDVSRYLASMDVYLAPMAEGISSRRTSIVAALAHGLPVVASSGALTDSVFREENGRALVLVDAHRGESFGGAVERLARSPGLREELGQAAAALAERSFSWESIAGRLVAELGARENAFPSSVGPT